MGLYASPSDKGRLLDPAAVKILRIVLVRNLAKDQFFGAIKKGLKPRMKGRDLSKIDEFLAMNPVHKVQYGDVATMFLIGDVVTMKLEGATMTYKR